MSRINEVFKILREKAELTQSEMAEKINKSQSAYARIESGITRTDFETLHDFAIALDMSDIDVITYPEKWAPIGSMQLDHNEPKVVLQIELKKEIKDQVLKLLFGGNNFEILNK